MSGHPLVLADASRAELFSQLADAGRFLARPQDKDNRVFRDLAKVPWMARRVSACAIGFTFVGPGWVFDPFAQQKREKEWKRLMQDAVQTPRQVRGERLLAALSDNLRLGRQGERLLWLIHQRVLAARTSVVRLPDFLLAETLWGKNSPRQWRSNVLAVLKGLAWLHVADWPDNGQPSFGETTALLIHVADLRGEADDTCGPDCPGHGGPHHHHYLVNIGRGFLGVLEEFVEPDDGSGVRHYKFPLGNSRSEQPTLRQMGKAGRLVTVYLPAKLEKPDVSKKFSAAQHRLLQSIVRETTRNTGRRRQSVAEASKTSGNLIPDFSGRKTVPCDLLDKDKAYVGFNGNGKRKGLGYRLMTPGGWLAKAGYAHVKIDSFLRDLGAISQRLGLLVVGVQPAGNPPLSLNRILALVNSAEGRQLLERLHLRIYSEADYIERWNDLFGWSAGVSGDTGAGEDCVKLLVAMERKKIGRRELARRLKVDPSFLTKVLSGKKPWPKELLAKALKCVEQAVTSQAGPTIVSRIHGLRNKHVTILDVALAYHARGWSVVPQMRGKKQPCVAWKPFQDRLPSKRLLRQWFTNWPTAGLAVVLGPVSNLLMMDVDGPEAHAALLEHLGREPMAPKAISGSGKPQRYHLFFECPDMPTRAKQTPWHPNLEFRGKGGIVIIPPSKHKSGREYAWAIGQTIDDLSPPPLPEQVVEALKPVIAKSPADVVVAQNYTDASATTREFLSGKIANGPHWNERLFRAACDLAGRDMPIEEAEPVLLTGAHPWSAGDAELACRTIQSAYSQPRRPSRH